MEIDRINYLLQQYYSGHISEEERSELSFLLDNIPSQVLEVVYQKFMEMHIQHAGHDLEVSAIDRDIRFILDLDKDLPASSGRGAKRIRVLRRSSPLVAAVFLVLLIITCYWSVQFWGKNGESAQVVAFNKEEDFLPGREGAILTLSDGTEVVLDSLDKQVTIKNTDGVLIEVVDGQIIYRNTEPRGALQPLRNTISTAKGRQHQVKLSDGTRVWLNAESSITYPVVFLDTERHVSIKGEVYFEVARYAGDVPFTVDVSGTATSIRVLGTKFNVNAYGDRSDVMTTLLEGIVEVSNKTHIRTLRPGQQASISLEQDSFEVQSGVDLGSVMAWKQNRFSFDNTPLDIVMKELGRWYGFETVYQGQVPPYRYSGKIDKNLSFKQVLNLLGATNIQYTVDSDKQITIINK